MSSVSSIGGGTDVVQLFKKFPGNNKPASKSTSAASSLTSPLPAAASSQATRAQGHHHGRADAATTGLFQQLQQTVSSSLQAAQLSTGGGNANQTISDAISKILKNRNESTASIGKTGSAGDTDADAAHANTAASLDGSSSDKTAGAANVQSFAQVLQSFGVNPQQFHSDFLSAIQNAQNGSVNPATAFQSIPKGSLVDAVG